MSSRPELKLDWCSHAAAKYAVEHWHYSVSLPAGKLVKIGVWEGGEFIGAVVFSRGANRNIGSPYGVDQTAICELVRVALTQHETPVSRVVRVALLFLQRRCPGLRVCVSYADPAQGHSGGIYQAGNWLYVGTSTPQSAVTVHGKEMHKRSATAAYGHIRGLTRSGVTCKHKYLMPLDPEMRERIAPLTKPYPKREQSAENGTAAPTARGGVIPTCSLHLDSGNTTNERPKEAAATPQPKAKAAGKAKAKAKPEAKPWRKAEARH